MTLREDRYHRQRDEAREELARLREQVEKLTEANKWLDGWRGMNKVDELKAQLQAADAVVDEAEATIYRHPNRRTDLIELCKAYRATQKGGE